MTEAISSDGFNQFIHGRVRMAFDGRELKRAVHSAEILRESDASTLDAYMADRVPYFYKDPRDIAESFGEGYFVSSVRQLLGKLPAAQSFRESHFGEIVSGVYGEEVLGLQLLYSKLALLTAENANAYKMDLLFFRPGKNPAEFVFAEVKSSTKTDGDGLPAGHDKVCFANLFRSFNAYKKKDQEFDLALIGDRMREIEDADAQAIRRALLPHTARKIEYAGFCVIDHSTQDEEEALVLGTRTNAKRFDVDLLCVADLPEVAESTYEILDRMRG